MKKEEVRSTIADIKELLEGIMLAVMWLPQARVVSLVGTIFLKASPYVYDIFKTMIHTTPLDLADEPLPTAAEMERFFTVDYPALAPLLTPLDDLTPRKRHLKMQSIYQDLRYGTNADVMQQLYPLKGKKAFAVYEQLVRDNQGRQHELIVRFVIAEVANNGILGEETAHFAAEQLRKLTDRDLSSKAVRSKVGAALRVEWKSFLHEMRAVE